MAWPAWLVDLWAKAQPYADRAAVWRGYEADLTSLTILTIGVAVYTLLVFTFYRNLAVRSAFHTGWGKGRWWGRAIHGLESALIFPAMSFAYFGVLALALFFLAKGQTTYQVLLISMAIVTAVRLTSFVTEGAAGDLAKLLPLGLLGVFIVNPADFTWEAIWARYRELPGLLPVLGRFFLLFLVLEAGLRLASLVKEKLSGGVKRRRGRTADDTVRLNVRESAPAPKTKLR